MMAERFENSGFGPVSESDIADELWGHSFSTYAKFFEEPIFLKFYVRTKWMTPIALQKSKLLQEKKDIKAGYLRIKTKVNEVRQDYRKAINQGRRSGSGKLVCYNWDLLKSIWVGSPAAVTISNSKRSFNMEHIDEEEQEEEEEKDILGNNNDNDDAQYDDSIDFDDREEKCSSVRNPS